MARNIFKLTVLLLAVLWVCPRLGLAADEPVPTRDEIQAAVQNQIAPEEERVREQQRDISTAVPPPPEVVVEEEKPEAPALPGGPSFTVKAFKLEGNTVFSSKDLTKYTGAYEGRKISFTDVRDLTNQLTQHYRSQGYVTSRAFVPPQEMTDGTVTIRIVEGKVGKILVENNRWFRQETYQKFFPVKEGDVFRLQNFESALASLNQQPDRTAKAYLIAGETAGTSDIILKVQERFPVHAGYEFHNRGTKFTHRYRHDLFLSNNNLLGFGDTLNTSLSMGEEGAFLAGSAQYRYFFPSTRTTLNFDGSVAHSQLVRTLKSFDIDGKSFSLIPGITQNFWRNRRFSLDGNAAFEIKDSMTTVGDDKISYDRMRVLRFGPQAEIRDSRGKTRLGGDVHIGIPRLLGGSETHDRLASRKNSGGQFVYYTMNTSRLHKLPMNSFMILRANAQISPTTLTSLEQHRLGGAYSVRGYPEGDSAGDYGFGFSSEARIPPVFISKDWKLPFAKRAFRDSFNFVGFFEGGKTYLLQRETTTAEKNRLLLSAGFGFRFYFDQYLSTSLDVGYPFGDRSAEKNLPQIHLSIKVEY